MFARAMNSSADGTVRAAPDLRADVAALAGVLVGEVEALGTAAVRPKQAALRKALEELLFEVVALQARPGRPQAAGWGCLRGRRRRAAAGASASSAKCSASRRLDRLVVT